MELPTAAAPTSRHRLQESSEEDLLLFQEPYTTPGQLQPNWQRYSEPKISPYHMGEDIDALSELPKPGGGQRLGGHVTLSHCHLGRC